jgi:hypothetical protein
MSSRIFSTFSVLLLVLGRPELSSYSTDTRPALKREWHSKTAARLNLARVQEMTRFQKSVEGPGQNFVVIAYV